MSLAEYVRYRSNEKVVDVVNDYVAKSDRISYDDYACIRNHGMYTEEPPLVYECLGVWEFARSLKGADKLSRFNRTGKIAFSFDYCGQTYSVVSVPKNGYMEVSGPETYIRCRDRHAAVKELGDWFAFYKRQSGNHKKRI